VSETSEDDLESEESPSNMKKGKSKKKVVTTSKPRKKNLNLTKKKFGEETRKAEDPQGGPEEESEA